jgi:hypothetical protein
VFAASAATTARARVKSPAMRILASFALLLSLAACGGGSKSAAPAATPEPAPAAEPDPAPVATGEVATCEQVADHIVELFLSSEQFKNASPAEQKQVQDTMPEARTKVVADCTDNALPPEVRSCVMGAQSLEALGQCEGAN